MAAVHPLYFIHIINLNSFLYLGSHGVRHNLVHLSSVMGESIVIRHIS